MMQHVECGELDKPRMLPLGNSENHTHLFAHASPDAGFSVLLAMQSCASALCHKNPSTTEFY